MHSARGPASESAAKSSSRGHLIHFLALAVNVLPYWDARRACRAWVATALVIVVRGAYRGRKNGRWSRGWGGGLWGPPPPVTQRQSRRANWAWAKVAEIVRPSGLSCTSEPAEP